MNLHRRECPDMPRSALYKVTLTCNAMISNTYHVTARSEDEAITEARTGEHPCVDEHVEVDRETDADAVILEPAAKGKRKEVKGE